MSDWNETIQKLQAGAPGSVADGAVAVKALEWVRVPAGKYVGLTYKADSIRGEYLAQKGHAYFDDQLIEGVGPTLSDGKAAAQADYDSRIRSALVTHPLPQAGAESELVELVAYQQREQRFDSDEWSDWYPSNKEAFDEANADAVAGALARYEVRALVPAASIAQLQQRLAEAFEEAAQIAEDERKKHDTGDGFDSQPAHAAAFRIREAIRARSFRASIGEKTP